MSFAPILSRRRSFLLGATAAAAALTLPYARAAASIGPDLSAARRKLDVYDALVTATHRMASSFERYAGSVDPVAGPTGRETRINGVYAPDTATAELAAAERMLASPPAAAEPDRAAKALVHFYREAFPVMTEAARFYETYAPKEDQGRAGQSWHRRIHSTAYFATDARRDLHTQLHAMRRDVEAAELAAFERQGRGVRWEIRRMTVEARRLVDLFPVEQGSVDQAALAAGLASFGALSDEFDATERQARGRYLMFAPAPRSFTTAMHRLRAQMSARPDPSAATATDCLMARSAYANLVQMADLTIPMVA